jgi:hypothetical protein
MKHIAAVFILVCFCSCVSEPLPDEVKIADAYEQKAIDAAAYNYEIGIKEAGVEIKRLSNAALWEKTHRIVAESRPVAYTQAEVLGILSDFEAERQKNEADFDAIIAKLLAKNEAKKASEIHKAKSEYMMAVDESARKIRDLVKSLTGGTP